MNDTTEVNTDFLGIGKEPCSICGSEVYNQKPTLLKFNGTCSPECARTKAIVDALQKLTLTVAFAKGNLQIEGTAEIVPELQAIIVHGKPSERTQ